MLKDAIVKQISVKLMIDIFLPQRSCDAGECVCVCVMQRAVLRC